MEKMDICRFCGQVFMPNDENAPEVIRLDNGTAKCDCPDAEKMEKTKNVYCFGAGQAS